MTTGKRIVLRGMCPECNYSYRLTKGKRLINHSLYIGQSTLRMKCPGSGVKPVEKKNAGT